MSDGYTSSSPTHTITQEMGINTARETVDPRVRFTASTHSREEVSLYGTPKEEIMPNVNSSRYFRK